MWVKICGITREQDALLARDLGADAIGLVFTASSRRVLPEQVAPWLKNFTGIEKVGVFMDEDPREIAGIAGLLQLDTIQVHGRFTPAHLPLAEKFKIILALNDLSSPGALRFCERHGFRLLFDHSRGSGKTAVWEPLPVPVILAGGLAPGNVHEAIERAGPVGVDVSSGVEQTPGIKDPDKMKRFIQEATR